MTPFADIHTYITCFLGGVAVSFISLYILFVVFEVEAPLTQALWMSVMVSFVNLIPYIEYFFPIPLLAYLLARKGKLSGGGIMIILVVWLALNSLLYIGMDKKMGYKFSKELPGMQKVITSINKAIAKK
jgi:hypothetical protein